MTELEMLLRDIDGLRDSILLDWLHLSARNLTPQERVETRQTINLCIAELAELIARLDALENSET